MPTDLKKMVLLHSQFSCLAFSTNGTAWRISRQVHGRRQRGAGEPGIVDTDLKVPFSAFFCYFSALFSVATPEEAIK